VCLGAFKPEVTVLIGVCRNNVRFARDPATITFQSATVALVASLSGPAGDPRFCVDNIPENRIERSLCKDAKQGHFESAVGPPTEVVVPGGALPGRRFKTGRSSSEKESEEESGSAFLPRSRVEEGVTVRAA
jgi:hypothetical protein